MVNANAIQRTIHIRHEAQCGTAFFVDENERQYLVTAKHVVQTIADVAVISILHNEKWIDVPVRLVGHAPDDVDISVLCLPNRIVESALVLPADSAGMVVSQDVFFLGFPFGLFANLGELNSYYPVCFVKKAIVSCFEFGQIGLHKIFLDGMNNPGFSGGPVVFSAPGTSFLKVAAVISGYRFDEKPVYVNGNPVLANTRENTGIIHSYGIGYAKQIILNNQIGPL